jgi:DNA-binding NarL/FixJ family response regulator
MQKRISVLLVDDHTLVRKGIGLLIDRMEGIEVVGEAANGFEAVELTKSLRPDVVLMDIFMSRQNGLEATRRITNEVPTSKILMLSVDPDEACVHEAFSAGASGYLVKDAAVAELEEAIRSPRNNFYLSKGVSGEILKITSSENVKRSPLEKLTPRQREILQLIAEGESTKEIGGLLSISTKTVETHRTQLMERLDIHDVPGLVRFAFRVGLISKDS